MPRILNTSEEFILKSKNILVSKSHKIIFLTEKPQEVSVLETIQLELYCQTAYKVKLFLSFSTSSLVQKSPPALISVSGFSALNRRSGKNMLPSVFPTNGVRNSWVKHGNKGSRGRKLRTTLCSTRRLLTRGWRVLLWKVTKTVLPKHIKSQ